jgi:hypothetical protein
MKTVLAMEAQLLTQYRVTMVILMLVIHLSAPPYLLYPLQTKVILETEAAL